MYIPKLSKIGRKYLLLHFWLLRCFSLYYILNVKLYTLLIVITSNRNFKKMIFSHKWYSSCLSYLPILCQPAAFKDEETYQSVHCLSDNLRSFARFNTVIFWPKIANIGNSLTLKHYVFYIREIWYRSLISGVCTLIDRTNGFVYLFSEKTSISLFFFPAVIALFREFWDGRSLACFHVTLAACGFWNLMYIYKHTVECSDINRHTTRMSFYFPSDFGWGSVSRVIPHINP